MLSAASRSTSARSARLLALLSCVLSALIGSLAHGDAASGTYTGAIQLRGNYYWEKSTRVVAPSAAIAVASPSGVRVEGAYLLDAITSASQATGVITDNVFTEKRNEAHAGVGYEVDFGARQLDVSVTGRYSKEPDYLSRGVGFASALSLNQRNTVLHLSGYFVHDDVYRTVREAPADSPGRLRASRPVAVGDLQVLSLGFAWDQVLNQGSTLTLGYDLSRLDGFQANAYRMVRLADGGGAPERHPDLRLRHAGYLWLSHFVTRTRTALRAGYRLYYDSWELLAHAPELRVHQELGPHLEIRLRYRYFSQRPPWFFRPGGNLRSDKFITEDPKMSRFHDQTLGLKLRLSLDFLAFTPLEPLRTAVIDWGVEYVFNTNRYGNGVIAQGGVSWAF